jgi:hypothetical protein
MENIIDIIDPNVVKQQYEKLRANALGELNRAPLLNVFIRSGMHSWLNVLSQQGNMYPSESRKPPSVAIRESRKIPGIELCSILADAILNSSGTVKSLGAHG